MQKSSHAYFCTRMYKNLRYKNKRETRGVASQFDDCLRACARMDGRAGMYVHTFIDILIGAKSVSPKKLIWFLSAM